MDEQTASVFNAMRHPGAAFLLRLLEGPATEDELRAESPDKNQSTANRRLATLSDLGILEREAGPRQSRGRKWTLAFPEETDALLAAAAALVEAVATRRDQQRQETSKRLRRSRAHRRLRDVSGGAG